MNEDCCAECSDKIQPEQRNHMYEEVTTWRKEVEPIRMPVAGEEIRTYKNYHFVLLPTGRKMHGDCVKAQQSSDSYYSDDDGQFKLF